MKARILTLGLLLLASMISLPSFSQLENFYEKKNGNNRLWDINIHSLNYNVADNASPSHSASLSGIFLRVRLDNTGKGNKHVLYQNDLFEDAVAVIISSLFGEGSSTDDASPVTNFLLGDYSKAWNLNDDDQLSIAVGFNLADRFFFVGQNDTTWKGLYGFGLSAGPYAQVDYAINDKFAARIMGYGSQVFLRDSKYNDDRVEKRVKPLVVMLGAEILSHTGLYLGYELKKPIYDKTLPGMSRSALRLGYRF